MHTRNLRHLLLAGAARLLMSADDGAEEPAAAGGAPPAAAAPAEGEPPAGGESQAAPDAGDAPAGEPAADAVDSAEPEAKKTRVPWQNKRIDQLTARAATAEEQAAAALAEAADTKRRLEAYEALYGKDGSAPPAPAAAPAAPSGVDAAGRKVFTEEDVQKEAARIAGIQDLNRRCEGLFKEGTEKHGEDFQKRVNAAGQAFGADLRQRADFFEVLTALPNGADVYHQLTGDLDHFAEVLAMGPAQMGMELASLATKASTKKPPAVSGAPAPIVPVEGAGGNELPDDKVDMGTYATRFEERRLARAKERGLA